MPKKALRPSCAQQKHESSSREIHIDWSQILVDAVNKPGVISDAYRAFWNYSIGNQLLALFECMFRHIEPGPIHTFKGWLSLNRHVKRGEKAITLCMPIKLPITVKQTALNDSETDKDTADKSEVITRQRFIYRPNWFVLSQTEGAEHVPLAIPKWDERMACHRLMIDRERFTHTNGNCQGYARDRQFSVSPMAFLPHRTAFHEIAHIILGHTEESMSMSDGSELTPRDVREVEAEAVSLICCQSLGLPGEEFSRGYLQHWLGSKKIEERSVHRIFKASESILTSGYPDKPVDANVS